MNKVGDGNEMYCKYLVISNVSPPFWHVFSTLDITGEGQKEQNMDPIPKMKKGVKETLSAEEWDLLLEQSAIPFFAFNENMGQRLGSQGSSINDVTLGLKYLS